ncbi:MAG: vanadium-dependent haloperoxidase [Longimicrobiaceae bacterium]
MAQLPRREEERRLAALGIRQQAAELAAERPHVPDENNGDEVNYNQTDVQDPDPGEDPPFIGNFSKGLRHDSLGDPDPVSYGSLLRALQSRDPGDFEQILLGTIDPGARRKKLTNPEGGLAFDLKGPDAQELTVPPAPRFDSEVEAHEEGELYWMAVARDVAFIDYGSDPLIAAAISSLNSEFPWFGGTVPVTAQNVFRGIYPGEQVGPYVSQFLWKGNSDPRKMPGGGRNASDGYIAYGSQVIDQRQQTVLGYPDLGAAADYLTDFAWWLRAQNGEDFRGADQFDFTTRRFIRNLRDGANYVHLDLVINAWYNAAWILLSEPTGNQEAAGPGAVPMRDREFPLDRGNPYEMPAPDSPTEVGFVTFGDPHVIEVLTEVIGLAGRAVWYQKWYVHRRLRPEEFGGRIDNWLNGRRTYPIHPSIRDSLLTGGLSPYFGSPGDRYPSYLLPQAFPEGAPTHPAYGAGHATISGACATILKAFFDESKAIESPVIAAADGLSLLPYTGPDAAQMTVGGELNKLAGNDALFRNAGGVHWRSDYTQSLLLGEAVAIRLLQELSTTFNEDEAYFQLTRFDGTTIRIEDGFVDTVPAMAGS